MYERGVQPDLRAASDPGKRHGLPVDPDSIHDDFSR
jgi:hypothetical protein